MLSKFYLPLGGGLWFVRLALTTVDLGAVRTCKALRTVLVNQNSERNEPMTNEIRLEVEQLEERIAPSQPPGLLGYEGQPGNQGGHGGNGLLGYEGQPGNQGG